MNENNVILYILEDGNLQPCPQVEKWDEWMKEGKHIKEDVVQIDGNREIIVLTVFLGIAHPYTENENAFFETIVFNQELQSVFMRRYPCLLRAELGHSQIVAYLKNMLKVIGSVNEIDRLPNWGILNKVDISSQFSAYGKFIFEYVKGNGFWDQGYGKYEVSAKMMQCVGELSEALEVVKSKAGWRNTVDKKTGLNALVVELADTVIRIVDLCTAFDINVFDNLLVYCRHFSLIGNNKGLESSAPCKKDDRLFEYYFTELGKISRHISEKIKIENSLCLSRPKEDNNPTEEAFILEYLMRVNTYISKCYGNYGYANLMQSMDDDWSPDHFGEMQNNMAMALLCIMELGQILGLNVAYAIVRKMEYNFKRPYKHGKRI